jgi:integrase
MTGSLQEKKGIWYMVLNYQDTDGKRKQKWKSTGIKVKDNQKRKALKVLADTIAEYKDTIYIEPQKDLFANYLIEWLELHKFEVQTTTYNGYAHMVNKYMYPFFFKRRIKLTELRPMDIQKYYAYLSTEAKLSANTIIKHHQVIHRCLEYALRNRYVTENICNYVTKPQKTFTEHSFLELEQINELINCVKGHKIEIPTLLAIYYGLRRSEAIGLTWQNVDFESDTIKIRQKVVRTFDEQGKLTIEISSTLKTNASYREFPLIPKLKQRLIEHKKDIMTNQTFFGGDYCKLYLDYVCVDEKGILLNPDYISAAYKKIVKKNNLPDSSFHSLRHSCGSLLLAMGYNIKEIQKWLGHASFQTTMNIYSHTEKDFKNDITDSLSQMISLSNG